MFSQEALHNHAADNEGGHAECPVCLVSNTAPAAAVLANYYNSSCFPDRAPPKI